MYFARCLNIVDKSMCPKYMMHNHPIAAIMKVQFAQNLKSIQNDVFYLHMLNQKHLREALLKSRIKTEK